MTSSCSRLSLSSTSKTIVQLDHGRHDLASREHSTRFQGTSVRPDDRKDRGVSTSHSAADGYKYVFLHELLTSVLYSMPSCAIPKIWRRAKHGCVPKQQHTSRMFSLLSFPREVHPQNIRLKRYGLPALPYFPITRSYRGWTRPFFNNRLRSYTFYSQPEGLPYQNQWHPSTWLWNKARDKQLMSAPSLLVSIMCLST